MPLLEIDIEARYAKFRDAMTQIERQTQRSAANMAKAFDGVKSTLASLGVTAAAGAFTTIVKNAIDVADTLNDLSKKTGISVETLGGLGFAAGQAGGSLESITDAADKLNKSIAGAAGGNKEFAEAFKAMGIDIEDAQGKLKTADQVMVELANAFQSYADGPEKVAIAQRLLGKSGADMIGFLNDGGQAIQENIEFYKRFAGITQETADRADAFNDVIGKAGVITGAFGRAVAAELLPSLESMSSKLLESTENGDQFNEWAGRAASAIKGLSVIAASNLHGLDKIADTAGFAKEALQALANAEPGKIGEAWARYQKAMQDSANAFSGTYQSVTNPEADKDEAIATKYDKQIQGEWNLFNDRNRALKKLRDEDQISDKEYQARKLAAHKEAVEETRKLIDSQISTLTDKMVNAKTPEEAASLQARIDAKHKEKFFAGEEKRPAPILSSGKGSSRQGPVDDLEIKAADARNRVLEGFSEREREILADRMDFLSAYYQDDLISIGDYFAGRRVAQQEALRAQEANIDQEIANLQELKPKDARQKLEVDGKIEALIARRSQLQEDAGRAAIQLSIDETRAAKAFQDTLAGINAELLEQQGLLPQAAGIRFDQSNERLKTRLETERDAATSNGDAATAAERSADLDKLARLRVLAVARAELNSIEEVAAQVQFKLTEATERAALGAKTGATSELESLRTISDARLQAVADLQQVATAMDAVAQATGDVRMLEQAKALKLEIEGLAASADLVRERFEDAFSGPFESALDKMISGTASLKDAIKGLFGDIASEFSRMTARDLTKQLLGEKGALGGMVDFTARIFGGDPKAPKDSASVADALAKASPKDAALALQTQAVDANRVAMEQLTQAAQNAANVLSRLPAPDVAGSFDAAPYIDGSGTGESAEVPADAAMALGEVESKAAAAAAGVAQLAAAADLGNGALSRLPAIVSLFQSIVAATSTSNAANSGGNFLSAIAGMFGGGSGGGTTMDYEAAVAVTGMFAKGGIFEAGDVVPFAKGGLPSLVNVPTYFPMAGGKTGLMGEAGPEAIMPLARDQGGELAVRMVGERGNITLLPITRDHSGRMAVRSVDKAFATGGVFGAAEPTRWVGTESIREQAATSVLSGRGDTVVVPLAMAGGDHGVTPGKAGDTYVQLTVAPPAGANRASASQWGAEAGRQIQRSLRRNT